jgi:serine/threonine protein kinase
VNIPAYQIVQELGKGGMEVVYLVRHKKDGRQVALKVMLSKVAVKGAGTDEVSVRNGGDACASAPTHCRVP